MSYGARTWDVGQLYREQDTRRRVPMRALLGIPGDVAAAPTPALTNESKPSAALAYTDNPYLERMARGQFRDQQFSTLEPGPNPTLAQRAGDIVQGGARSGDFRQRLGSAVTGAVDMSTLQGLQDLYRSATGQSGQPLAMAAMGLVPGGKGAKRAVGAFADDVANPQTFFSGFSKIKHSMPLEEMTATRVPTGQLMPARPADIQALQGHYIQALPGDRTAAGATLTHVNESKLPWEVDLQGGGDYMRYPHGMGWASGGTVIPGYVNKLTELAKEGRPIHGVHMTMGQSGGDFSHMNSDALLGMVQNAKILKKDAKSFDEMMKGVDPAWAGVLKPDKTRWQLASDPGLRTAFVKGMDEGTWRKAGFPDVAAARMATTDPRLAQAGYGANTVTTLDPSKGVVNDPSMMHKSYPQAMASLGYQGTFEDVIPRDLLLRDWRARQKPGSTESNLQYSLGRQLPHQYVDQELIDTILRWQERRR